MCLLLCYCCEVYLVSFKLSPQVRHNKAISRDTWSQLLEFAKVSSKQIASYISSIRVASVLPMLLFRVSCQHMHVLCVVIIICGAWLGVNKFVKKLIWLNQF